MERINIERYWFSLSNGMSMETLVSQFQPLASKILCVKDGSELYLFGNEAEIPPSLSYESSNVSSITCLQEFHFRSTVDGSLYTFFKPEVSNWIRSGRATKELKVAAKVGPEPNRELSQGCRDTSNTDAKLRSSAAEPQHNFKIITVEASASKPSIPVIQGSNKVINKQQQKDRHEIPTVQVPRKKPENSTIDTVSGTNLRVSIPQVTTVTSRVVASK